MLPKKRGERSDRFQVVLEVTTGSDGMLPSSLCLKKWGISCNFEVNFEGFPCFRSLYPFQSSKRLLRDAESFDMFGTNHGKNHGFSYELSH